MDRRRFLGIGLSLAALPGLGCAVRLASGEAVAVVGRRRLRELGIRIGTLPQGPLNAITDVPGVAVGHVTLIQGSGPLRVGSGPVRTGVTAVLPHRGDLSAAPVLAADLTLNGNGELTGLGPLRRTGRLGAPILLTDTGNVGTVYDGAMEYMLSEYASLGSGGFRPEPVVGETWEEELALLNSPAPISFRAVQGAISVPLVIKELARWNLTAREDPRFPEAVLLPSNQPPYETAPFQQGRIVPQDPASQAVVTLADPLMGELVVDLGAGLGTKTEQLLSRRTSDEQRILAVDISPSRLARLKERLPDPAVSALVADITGNLPLRKGAAGTVVLDAPCSNLGTIRRHPEVMWWRRSRDLSAATRRQRAMLRQAARLLGPGGRLVYAVCSFVRAEGVDLVEGFLASNPRFRAVPVPEALAMPGTPYMLTTPARHGTDMFFAAVIERTTGTS